MSMFAVGTKILYDRIALGSHEASFKRLTLPKLRNGVFAARRFFFILSRKMFDKCCFLRRNRRQGDNIRVGN